MTKNLFVKFAIYSIIIYLSIILFFKHFGNCKPYYIFLFLHVCIKNYLFNIETTKMNKLSFNTYYIILSVRNML